MSPIATTLKSVLKLVSTEKAHFEDNETIYYLDHFTIIYYNAYTFCVITSHQPLITQCWELAFI